MVRAKNYETVSTFVKVMQKKPWPLFFPDTVYITIMHSNVTSCPKICSFPPKNSLPKIMAIFKILCILLEKKNMPVRDYFMY